MQQLQLNEALACHHRYSILKCNAHATVHVDSLHNLQGLLAAFSRAFPSGCWWRERQNWRRAPFLAAGAVQSREKRTERMQIVLIKSYYRFRNFYNNYVSDNWISYRCLVPRPGDGLGTRLFSKLSGDMPKKKSRDPKRQKTAASKGSRIKKHEYEASVWAAIMFVASPWSHR